MGRAPPGRAGHRIVLMGEISEDLILVWRGLLPVPADQTLADVIRFVSILSDDPRTVIWCLTNLHRFSHAPTREFAVGTLFHFVSSLFSSIPPAAHAALCREFFTDIFADPAYVVPSFLPRIYHIGAVLVRRLYPDDFLDRLIAAGHLIAFIRAFSLSVEGDRTIEDRMLADGKQAQIFSALLEALSRSDESAVPAFCDALEWIHPSLFMCELPVFLGLFGQQETAALGLEIFIHIFSRETDPELAKQINLVGCLSGILPRFSDIDILKKCAKLVCQTRKFVDPDMLPIAVDLFRIPNLEITTSVKIFLNSALSEFPEFMDSFLDVLLQKIADTISLEIESADQILECALSLLLKAKKREAIPQLLGIFATISPTILGSSAYSCLPCRLCLKIRSEPIFGFQLRRFRGFWRKLSDLL
jgi:hypothetical protein